LSEEGGAKEAREGPKEPRKPILQIRLAALAFAFSFLHLLVSYAAEALIVMPIPTFGGFSSPYESYQLAMDLTSWISFLLFPVSFFLVLYWKAGAFVSSRDTRSTAMSLALGGLLSSAIPIWQSFGSLFNQSDLVLAADSLSSWLLYCVDSTVMVVFVGLAAIFLFERRSKAVPSVAKPSVSRMGALGFIPIVAGMVAFGWGVDRLLYPQAPVCYVAPSYCPPLTYSQWWVASWPGLALVCMGCLLIVAGVIWLQSSGGSFKALGVNV
jgi:hypothetical protein